MCTVAALQKSRPVPPRPAAPGGGGGLDLWPFISPDPFGPFPRRGRRGRGRNVPRPIPACRRSDLMRAADGYDQAGTTVRPLSSMPDGWPAGEHP
jgi:hypothetical protein